MSMVADHAGLPSQTFSGAIPTEMEAARRGNPDARADVKLLVECGDSVHDGEKQQPTYRPAMITNLASQTRERDAQSPAPNTGQAATGERKVLCESRPSTLKDVEAGGGFADHAEKAIQYMDHVRQL